MADRAVGIPIVKEGVPFVGILGGAALLAGFIGLGCSRGIAGWFDSLYGLVF